MAVSIAADDPFSQPLRRDMRRSRVVRANSLGILFERFSEFPDILSEFAHHQVAAVEAEIQQSIRRTVRLQVESTRRLIVGNEGTRRLLVMRIDVADQYFAERDAVPIVTFGRAVIRQDDVFLVRIFLLLKR